MAGFPRLQGGRTEAWTITADNQVGPDTATQSDRTIPSYTGNVIFVGKIGSDANAGTSEAAPKLTIQAAINAASSGAKSFVVIIDSEVYRESIDQKGLSILAKNGFYPTIEYAPSIYATAEATISAGNAISFAEYWYSVYSMLVCNSTVYKYNILLKTSATITSTGAVSVYPSGDKLFFQYNSGSTYKIQYITTTTNTPADYADLSSYLSGDIVYFSPMDSGIVVAENGSTFEVYQDTNSPSLIADGFDSLAAKGDSIYLTKGGRIYTYSSGALIDCSIADTIDSVYSIGDTVYLTSGASGNIYTASKYVPANLALFGSLSTNANDMYIDDFGRKFISDNSGNDILMSRGNFSGYETFSGSYDYVFLGGFSTDGSGVDKILIGASDGKIYRIADYVSWSGSVNNASGVPAYLNGIALDGRNIASIGAYEYYSAILANNEIGVNWCKLKNCEIGVLGTGSYKSNSDVSKNIYENCGKALSGFESDALTTTESVFNGCEIITESGIEDCTAYNCGLGQTDASLAKNNIFWNCSIPFSFPDTISGDSQYDFNLYNQPANAADIEMYTTQYTSNPLFVDESNNDFRLKSIARGDKIDSLYIAGGTNDASDGTDLGAYKFTRTLTGTTYEDDYTLYVKPQTVTETTGVPGYNSSNNLNGEFFEWASLEDGEYLRRTFSLSYPNIGNSKLYKMIQDLRYFASKVGAVYRFGYSSNGTTWDAYRSGTGTVSGSTIAITAAGEAWGVNKWAGYWILIDGTYYRITGSTAKTATGSCTLTVEGAPTAGSQAYSIDFILVRIAKRATLSSAPATYLGEDDFDTTNPLAINYTIELQEVDSES